MSKSSYVKLATDAGDQFLTKLAEGQETFLKSISAITSHVPAMPAAAPAFGAALPSPQEIAEANFAFTQKLLKQQKEFTEKLFAATSPASN